MYKGRRNKAYQFGVFCTTGIFDSRAPIKCTVWCTYTGKSTLICCLAYFPDDYTCNDVTLTEEAGVIRSPVPGVDVAYDDDVSCKWTIIAENDKVIELEIQSLSIPRLHDTISHCRHRLRVILLSLWIKLVFLF